MENKHNLVLKKIIHCVSKPNYMSQHISAFADEFGNNSFSFDTQGTHFIVATVIVKNENIKTLQEDIDQIRVKHKFQTGELKSSKVGSTHHRRIAILNDIVNLDFTIHAVIVDKTKLDGPGFSFKKSFYKYMNNLLYKELFRTFPQLDLHVDEHGGSDYLKEFKKYVIARHPVLLFDNSDFVFANSKNNNIIQLADFIAGTLGHIFDHTKASPYSEQFMSIISGKVSSLNHFPRQGSFQDLIESNTDESFDPKIAEACFMRVYDFLDRTTGSDQQKIDQIAFLKILLFAQRASLRNKYISTGEIKFLLNQNRDERIGTEYFRTKVVGSLRDSGIIVASSNNGYKIPTCAEDLDAFITHGKKIILPMLFRIKTAREAIKLATLNQLDILDKEIFSELRQIIDRS